MRLHIITLSPDSSGGSAPAAPPAPASGSSGTPAPAASESPATKSEAPAAPVAPASTASAPPPVADLPKDEPPKAEPFDWDKWDGTPDVAPEPFRPALTRAQKIASERYAAEQARQKAEWDAQKTAWQREREQERLGWRAKESEYAGQLKGTGMVKAAELEAARQEMENWKKIAAGMADPRLAEYEGKVKDYETKLAALASEKKALEDAAETQRARSLMDANPHLKVKATFDSFMELIEVGWEDDVAAKLAPMSKEERAEALEYALKYKLAPEQQPLALEWIEGKRRGSAKPSEGADVVGFVPENSSGRTGRGGPVNLSAAREAAAGRALRKG